MREKRKERREKIKKGVSAGLMFLAMALMLLNPVAAEEMSVNWTQIGDIIEGAGSIMPSVGSLITAVVPVLLLLIVVGFVTGLFDGIIGAINDSFRIFRR